MIFIESATVFVHQRVLFPGFRNHQHHRLGQRIAAHDQQFERVVEGGGIGLPRVMQRPDLLQVVAENRRGYRLFARLEPVDVAAHRVDFAIVGNVAKRVSQIPGREGIGREALVHHGQRGDGALVLQVEVIHADLIGQQQTLVVDGACREGWNVEFLAVLELERLDGVGGTAANDVQLAFERIGNKDIRATADKNLADDRLFGAHCRRHRHVAIDGYVAPAQDHLAFGLDGAFDFLDAGVARSGLLRQEDHADTVFAGRRQFDALPGHFFAIELVGNLNQNAGTVALQRISTHGAPVIQIFQDQQTLLDDAVTFLALEMGNKTHTASVVLVRGVVQTLLLRYCRCHHTRSFKKLGR